MLTGAKIPKMSLQAYDTRRDNRGMQARDGCWGPGACRLQLAGQPSATPR
eukprot:COSAG04_NODE_21666_length_369_cov_5.188889_1_plen_49_part_01